MIKRSSLLERMIASGMIALLCAGGAAWAQDNATGPAVPPGTEADHHASPAPEETWPPGLFMKCLEKAGVRKPLDDAGKAGSPSTSPTETGRSSAVTTTPAGSAIPG